MKIAILTLPLHINFGGILQCYALQTVLEHMGHNVTVLNPDLEKVDLSTRVEILSKRLIKTLLRKESKFYGWKTDDEVTRKHTQSFIKKYIHIGNVTDLSLMREDDFDAIVVGSDQIWRPLYYKPIANGYLKFAKDWTTIRRVAYAASFGTDVWEYSSQETEECASLLNLFDTVSVREYSGKYLCKKYLGKDAVQVLDPTLLLSKEDYLNLVGKSHVVRRNGGLCYYFLDITPEKLRLTKEIAEKRKLVPYSGNNPNSEKYYLHFEERVQLPVEQWLASMMDASLVVTDSFHGCVFSILFNKPFLALGNVERGMDRFNSLLSLFGLERNLIHDYNREFPMWNVCLDWKKINERLEAFKKTSLHFLDSSLLQVRK